MTICCFSCGTRVVAPDKPVTRFIRDTKGTRNDDSKSQFGNKYLSRFCRKIKLLNLTFKEKFELNFLKDKIQTLIF